MSPRPRWPYRRRVRVEEAPPEFAEPPPPEPTVPLPAAPPPGQPAYPAEVVAPPGPPEEPPPVRELWPWLLLLAIVVIAGLVIAWALTRHDDQKPTTTVVVQPTVRVPEVTGLREQEAIARLAQAGLKATVTRTRSDRPAGIVLAERPPAGSEVRRGNVITLVVSRGAVPSTVSVPDVVGLTGEQAETKLRAAGLRPQTKPVFSDKPAGTVLAQDPKAGDKVVRNSVVTVTVSRGAPTSTAVTVTTVKTVTTTTQTATTTTATTATATTATATTATTTTTTTTTAPPASRIATVPDVRGKTLSAARRAIRRAGLVAAIVYVRSSEPADTVLAQFPKPGTKAKSGSRVRTNISLGPTVRPQATIPDVTGLDEASAVSQLRSAGFVAETFDQETADPSADGVVLDQDPAAATRAPRGAVVTIYVGRYSG